MGGVGKFVVPKSTIPPPAQANRPRTVSAPGRRKAGKEGTDRLTTGKEREHRRDTPISNGGGQAVQDNGHINQKRTGETYNPSLEADAVLPPITPKAGTDLPGHTLTAYDRKPSSVYRYQVHCNDYTGVNSRQCPMADPVALDQQPHAKVLRRAQGQGQPTFRHAPH